MWGYIHKSVELAAFGKGHTQQEIALAAGVTEFQASRWHQKAEFLEAVALSHRNVQLVGFERAINALTRLAERGNVLAFTTVRETLERLGRLVVVNMTGSPDDPQASAGGHAVAVNGTHIHIHQIPEAAPRSTLPPPLELPVALSGNAK